MTLLSSKPVLMKQLHVTNIIKAGMHDIPDLGAQIGLRAPAELAVPTLGNIEGNNMVTCAYHTQPRKSRSHSKLSSQLPQSFIISLPENYPPADSSQQSQCQWTTARFSSELYALWVWKARKDHKNQVTRCNFYKDRWLLHSCTKVIEYPGYYQKKTGKQNSCENRLKKGEAVSLPGCTDVTPSPTLSTTPPPSWPRTQGNFPSGSAPLRVWASVWQTPEYRILTRTSPAFGGSTYKPTTHINSGHSNSLHTGL